MDNLFYINKIVRDDGAQLLFDHTEIFLDEDNELLMRPDVETTKVDYTEADGGEMVFQKMPSYQQPIRGIIVPKATGYWQLRARLTSFFVINHTYVIIYQKAGGGGMFKTSDGWIEDNLQVQPLPREEYSRFEITLGIGGTILQEYVEDNMGHEIFANSMTLPVLSLASGGAVWDSVGQVWDSVGTEWEAGSGGIQDVVANSTSVVYPTLEVGGDCLNPTIYNSTTGTSATYNGSISAGQTLVIDFAEGTAKLDGSIVTMDLSGSLSLQPGSNQVAFDMTSGTITDATLKWNNAI